MKTSMVTTPSPQRETLIHRMLSEISPRLLQNRDPAQLGLLGGLSGEVLAAWYLHDHDPALMSEDRIEEAVNFIQTHGDRLQRRVDFSTGLAGTAWLFEFLLAHQPDDHDPAFNDNSDLLLETITKTDNWQGDLEYVLGLAGLAVYGNRRLRVGRGEKLLDHIHGLFEQHGRWEGNQCAWPTPDNSPFRSRKGQDGTEFNLGLAHGVPAIIASMLPAIDQLPDDHRVRKMVHGGCHWLLSQQQDPDEEGSFFGYRAGQPARSRLGWCYGDPGIALTLLRAGQALDDPSLSEAGKATALHAAGRPASDSRVNDAGLCHGSAGLYLMFDFLNRLSPDKHLRQAADFWLDYVLDDYNRRGMSALDALVWDPEKGKPIYQPRTELLTGYAGIALVMLTALGGERDWADGLLME